MSKFTFTFFNIISDLSHHFLDKSPVLLVCFSCNWCTSHTTTPQDWAPGRNLLQYTPKINCQFKQDNLENYLIFHQNLPFSTYSGKVYSAFWRLCRRRLLKTLWQKKKLLLISNFSFCNNVLNLLNNYIFKCFMFSKSSSTDLLYVENS